MENWKTIFDKAEEYAKSISKNETYQKYLKDAFVAGSKSSEKQRDHCPHCRSADVIFFDSDNNMCKTCERLYSV